MKKKLAFEKGRKLYMSLVSVFGLLEAMCCTAGKWIKTWNWNMYVRNAWISFLNICYLCSLWYFKTYYFIFSNASYIWYMYLLNGLDLQSGFRPSFLQTYTTAEHVINQWRSSRHKLGIVYKSVVSNIWPEGWTQPRVSLSGLPVWPGELAATVALGPSEHGSWWQEDEWGLTQL